MRSHEKYFKLLLAVIIAFIPGIVFADSLTSISFTPPYGDISVGYLSKLFGSIPAIPQFSGSTILGAVFYTFNTGLLGISGIFLGYSTFRIITGTAMNGVEMAKTTTAWTAIRVAMGTSLLVPQASTGYSLINGIIMWTVLQAVGLADTTWKSAMNYLEAGGSSMAIASANEEMDYSLIDYTVGKGANANNIGSADVLRSLVCSYILKDVLSQAAKSSSGSQLLPNISEYSISKKVESVISSNGPGLYYFPYIEGDYPTLNQNYNIDLHDSSIRLNGICGVIGYSVPSNLKKSDGTDISSEYNSAKEEGLQSMISTLDPVAQSLISKFKSDGKRSLTPFSYVLYELNRVKVGFTRLLLDGGELPGDADRITAYQVLTPVTKDNAGYITWLKISGLSDLLMAAAKYQKAVSPVRSSMNQAASTQNKQLFEQAKKDGWIMAGSYYSLLRQQAVNNDLDVTSFRLNMYDPSTGEQMAIDDALNIRMPRVGGAIGTNFKFSYSGDKKDLKGIIYNTFKPNLETLRECLEWIYFSSQYTPTWGAILNALIQANAPTNKPANELIDFSKYVSRNMLQGGNPDLDLGLGVGLLSGGVTAVGSLFTLPKVPNEYLFNDVQQVIDDWIDIMLLSESKLNRPIDPIEKLRLLGGSMVDCSLNYLDQIRNFFVATSGGYTAANVVLAAIGTGLAVGTFWGSTTGGVLMIQYGEQTINAILEIVRSVIYIYAPLGIAVIAPIFLCGMALSMYVPLVPYMFFLFGVISWFMSVIILMAAAPIICFMMLWGPEARDNPLLSNEAEIFFKQLLAVFFRPALMIIGLIAGMMLSYIGVDLLNAGFAKVFSVGGIIESTNSSIFKNEGTILAKRLGFIVLYTFIMMSLVNICFSLIHLLYSEVMGLAGISVAARGIEEKAMGEVKSGAEGFAHAGISGAKESGMWKGGGGFKAFAPKGKNPPNTPAGGAEGNRGGQQQMDVNVGGQGGGQQQMDINVGGPGGGNQQQ